MELFIKKYMLLSAYSTWK